jgi:hypothetical protein
MIMNSEEIEANDSQTVMYHENDTKTDLHRWVLLRILTSPNWRLEFKEEFLFEFDENVFEDEIINREIAIFELRIGGETLEKIGSKFHLTRERIRQLLEQGFACIKDDAFFSGRTCSEVFNQKSLLVKEAQELEILNQKALIDMEVRKLLEFNPGLKIEEICSELSFTLVDVWNSIHRQTSKFIWTELKNGRKSQFTDAEILEALRFAERFESPLSQTMYKHLVDTGKIQGPGPQSVAIRFGTWSRASELAGIVCNEPVLSSYSRNWTKDELLALFVIFLKNAAFGNDVESYNEWRRKNSPSAPSSAHMRNNFGGWNSVKNCSLEYMKANRIACGLL